MSHFPMARASRLVVATTSLVLALMNTFNITNNSNVTNSFEKSTNMGSNYSSY